jgi:hypothetical protein
MSLWRRIFAGLPGSREAAGEADCETKTGFSWPGG